MPQFCCLLRSSSISGLPKRICTSASHTPAESANKSRRIALALKVKMVALCGLQSSGCTRRIGQYKRYRKQGGHRRAGQIGDIVHPRSWKQPGTDDRWREPSSHIFTPGLMRVGNAAIGPIDRGTNKSWRSAKLGPYQQGMADFIMIETDPHINSIFGNTMLPAINPGYPCVGNMFKQGADGVRRVRACFHCIQSRSQFFGGSGVNEALNSLWTSVDSSTRIRSSWISVSARGDNCFQVPVKLEKFHDTPLVVNNLSS